MVVSGVLEGRSWGVVSAGDVGAVTYMPSFVGELFMLVWPNKNHRQLMRVVNVDGASGWAAKGADLDDAMRAPADVPRFNYTPRA